MPDKNFNLSEIDKSLLIKLVKVLNFISNHIRQNSERELAFRLDKATYDLIEACFDSEIRFQNTKNLILLLLNIIKDKGYIKDNVILKIINILSNIFYKRQELSVSEIESSIKDDNQYLLDEKSEDKKYYIKDNQNLSLKDAINSALAKENTFIKDINYNSSIQSRKFPIIEEKRQITRRQQILNLLSKDPISIKEISSKIIGCSEKTIQRELNALLEDGVIKRIGEKRWSKYILI